METSLKTDFAQIFSRCPKFWGGAAAPLAPPARTPMGRFESIPSIFLKVLEVEIGRNNRVITEHQLTSGHICDRLYV